MNRHCHICDHLIDSTNADAWHTERVCGLRARRNALVNDCSDAGQEELLSINEELIEIIFSPTRAARTPMRISDIHEFLVWDPLNQFESDAVDRDWRYQATYPGGAAIQHADRRWSKDELATRTWPIDFRVRDLVTGKLYDVPIDHQLRSEYRPGKATEVT